MEVAEIRAQEFFYVTNGGTITIIGYNGLGGAVTIPDTITGLPVTAIEGWGAFSSTNVTTVTIPNSVTNIGDLTFKSCGLSTVSIGNNVTSIGRDAFALCTSLASIRIPDNVLSVGQYAFTSCSSLTNVVVGKGLTNLPADSAFYYCTNLMAITVDKDNQAFGSTSGVLFNRSQTQLLRFPSHMTGSYDVPQGVTEIGKNAFNGSTGLVTLSIPNSVTSIAYGALQNCPNLTGIYFTGSGPFAWSWTNDILRRDPCGDILLTRHGRMGSVVWGATDHSLDPAVPDYIDPGSQSGRAKQPIRVHDLLGDKP